jgi:hypothetical protein
MSLVVHKEQFALLRGELKSFTRSSDSGRPVMCSFSPECGTRIVHEARQLEGMVKVRAGTLDDTPGLKPDLQVTLNTLFAGTLFTLRERVGLVTGWPGGRELGLGGCQKGSSSSGGSSRWSAASR